MTHCAGGPASSCVDSKLCPYNSEEETDAKKMDISSDHLVNDLLVSTQDFQKATLSLLR